VYSRHGRTGRRREWEQELQGDAWRGLQSVLEDKSGDAGTKARVRCRRGLLQPCGRGPCLFPVQARRRGLACALHILAAIKPSDTRMRRRRWVSACAGPVGDVPLEQRGPEKCGRLAQARSIHPQCSHPHLVAAAANGSATRVVGAQVAASVLSEPAKLPRPGRGPRQTRASERSALSLTVPCPRRARRDGRVGQVGQVGRAERGNVDGEEAAQVRRVAVAMATADTPHHPSALHKWAKLCRRAETLSDNCNRCAHEK
jgi:hypothetical protein